MREPLLLYSTNTWLAYAIAERFYGGVHYAWCSPVYDGATAQPHVNIPPSSSPAEIYRLLLEETRRGERHSKAFVQNREGIRKGARAKCEAGIIRPSQEQEILQILKGAHPSEFRPILYVMPYALVRDRARDVPVRERAHPLSVEFRVFELPRDCFDTLTLRT